MAVRRRLIATMTGLPLAVVVLAAGAAAGGGPSSHAGGTFVDASGQAIGWVRLVEDGAGIVHVNVHVAGLAPGRHGIHIHGIAACGPTFGAAGGHYNPLGREHGLENPDGAHAGDLPNLIVNVAGNGHLDAKTDRVTISDGPTTLFDSTAGAVGSSFIIHADEDDQVNQPIGNSGARLACAVIEAR